MYFDFDFEGPIEEFGVGQSRKVWYRVLFLPKALEPQLPFDEYPRLRVDGEIAEIPINSAWIPAGDGRRYVIVSPTVMRTARLQLGDSVTMRFSVADQEFVDVPSALAAAIDVDKKANRVWQQITSGKRRALAHWVSSTKTQPTREKRVATAIRALRENRGRLR